MSHIEQKTAAFKRFVNQRFINHFDDYICYHYDIKDDDAEIALQSAMCQYYYRKIKDKFDFKQVKENYKKTLTSLSPNLSVQQKNKIVAREQAKLETLARLEYIDKDINTYCYELFQLIYLFSIFCKLNKKSLNDIAKSRVGQYLLYACMEYHVNFSEILNLPLSEQATKLYNSIALFDDFLGDVDFLLERGDAIPIVRVEIYRKSKFTLDLSPEELEDFENLREDQQVLFIANKRFHERLITEMHTQPNGMIF